MFNLIRTAKFSFTIMIAAIILTGAASRAYAETGSVHIKISKVGFIVVLVAAQGL